MNELSTTHVVKLGTKAQLRSMAATVAEMKKSITIEDDNTGVKRLSDVGVINGFTGNRLRSANTAIEHLLIQQGQSKGVAPTLPPK